MPKQKHKRSQSGYSILNNEHMYSKHSFFESPVSEASYDPFRASRQPIIPEKPSHPSVTVRRRTSNGSRNLRPATALGHRTGSSLRIQALRNSKRGSAVSRSSSKRTTPSQRSVHARSVSRSSLASSHWPSSPPVIARAGGIGRRGVSFSHLYRRGSTATASTADTGAAPYTSDRYTSFDRRRESIGSYGSSLRSGTVQQSPAARTKSRASAGAAVPRLRARKPDSPSKYIQSEARKVSTELGKVMEEAFNRSSMSSSTRSTHTDAYQDATFSQYDTPPTSFSNRDSGGSTIVTPSTKAMLASRPLPPIPKETPNTFLHRKLVETREDIARKLTEADDNTEHFTEVLEHLDRLIIPPANSKRVVSAPARSPEHPAPLHAIPEEVKVDGGAGSETHSPHYRAVTDPVRPQARRAVTAQDTIRLVDQSPTRVAPLNIRKRSGASLSSKYTNEVPPSAPWPGPSAQDSVRSYGDVQNDVSAARVNIAPPPAPEKQAPVIKKKKSLWFRRTTEEKDQQDKQDPQVKKKKSAALLQIPDAWQGLDDRIKNNPSPTPNIHHEASRHAAKQSDGSNVSEFPMRNTGPAATKNDSTPRKGFLGFFGKRKEEKAKGPMELGRKYARLLT